MFAANSGAASDDKTYIEDVFSTYLYTGNGSTQTINNGIDLAGKGGMVWIKNRTSGYSNTVFDTSRYGQILRTNTTGPQDGYFGGNTTFGNNGFSLGTDVEYLGFNQPVGNNFVSWTFRKAPKFFDVVTYTGNGVNQREISHNLGVLPGMIIVKRIDTASPWRVRHATNGNVLELNSTSGELASAGETGGYPYIGSSSSFKVGSYDGSNLSHVNASGGTYVAYLFAHDTTTDGLIQCGSYTGNGSVHNATTEQNGPDVNLGWEPQYLMIKNTSTSGDWWVFDTMRGLVVDGKGIQSYLCPNNGGAEGTLGGSYQYLKLTSTGFKITAGTGAYFNETGHQYIYMAIRRGPMKTPTDATKVFKPFTWITAQDTSATQASTSFPVDAQWWSQLDGNSYNAAVRTRLTGGASYMSTSATYLEQQGGDIGFDTNTGFKNSFNLTNVINWLFGRAPGFFDVVSYTGTGAARTVSHNLGVEPELMIVKRRTGGTIESNWLVYCKYNPNQEYNFLYLNNNSADGVNGLGFNSQVWNATKPTKTGFSVGVADTNYLDYTYVAQLFASCPGVSKVGSYTGNGSTQSIPCGFGSNGCSFILIKRTDAVGNWYIYDTARGISTGTDPYILANNAAAQIRGGDSVDQIAGGFAVNQSTENLNVNGASYIFLAIAGTTYDPYAGEEEFTTPGTYTWTAPAGVTSVSAVAVGGGGNGQANRAAGGGALAYLSSYAVVPGNTYTVVVGGSGQSSSVFGMTAGGGQTAANTNSAGAGGTLSGVYTGGSAGGASGSSLGYNAGGGGAGGYGGYTGGIGGNGGAPGTFNAGTAGLGGGGGGGVGVNHEGGQGGGVGIYGQGANGAGGTSGMTNGSLYYGNGGRGGSGGANGNNAGTGVGTGLYGGGGGAASASTSTTGAGGAVRIIWGTGRSYPANAI